MTDTTHEQMKVDEAPPPEMVENTALRWAFFIFGWLCVALGMIGVVVPGLPTTIFLIIAVWAFSRSSLKFQQWLWYHPKFGGPVRDWHRHRVICKKAKWLAAIMMTISFAYVVIYVAEDWKLPTMMAAVMLPSLLYVVTRASKAPEEEPATIPIDD